MTNTTDPVLPVLDKLRDAIIAGKHKGGLKWEYDYGDSYQSEDSALTLLETRGVINTLPGDTLLKVKPEGYVEYQGSSSPSDTKTWTRHITGINIANYEKVCSEYGLEPYHKTYSAHLELKDETVPLVTVGGYKYKLPALHAGSASDIILYAYKHSGRSISAKELRKELGLKQMPNVKDMLRAGLFAPPGLLSAFATTSPHSITFSSTAQLDNKQLARLRALN